MCEEFNGMLNELSVMPNGMYSIEKENSSLDIWLYPEYVRFEWRNEGDFCIYDVEISDNDKNEKVFEIVEYCCTKGGITIKDFAEQVIESRILNFMGSLDKNLIDYMCDENYE